MAATTLTSQESSHWKEDSPSVEVPTHRYMIDKPEEGTGINDPVGTSLTITDSKETKNVEYHCRHSTTSEP